MIKSILAISCFGIFICIASSCKKENNEDQLQQDFHGKYSILSATADKEVDLNFDGIGNKNLLKEIDILSQSYLELIIPKDTKKYVFSQFWQNQYFLGGIDTIPDVYDPDISVDYVNQATVASFSFNNDKTQLILSRDQPDPSFPLPQIVEILPNHNIKVIMDKEIYTKSGWEVVSMVVTYERFTNQL